MSARKEVLARIAAAHRYAPPPQLRYAAISRDYRTTSDLGADQLVERLADRLLDYRALVRRCPPTALRSTLREALLARGVGTLAVPGDLDDRWVPDGHLRVLRDRGADGHTLSVDQLDGVHGVLTGCAVAVAETGTLILDGSAGQGRRLVSLVPDYHLCVVFAHQIVADLPQALARLEPTRPLTMISGPSATSDIELNRVEGVHGPRTLEVVIVTDAG